MNGPAFALNIPSLRVEHNMAHALTSIRGGLWRRPTSVLLPAQMEVVHKVLKTIEDGNRAFYIDLPPGTGKTVIGSEILNALRTEAYEPKILFVTDSQTLVEQTEERFNQFAPNMPVGLYYQPRKQLDKSVTITTYASFPYFANHHAGDYDFLVFDEAHKVLSDNRIEYMQRFKNAVIMALTATPAYSDDKDLAQYFSLAARMSVREAIDASLNSGFRQVLIESDYADLDLVKLSNSGEYDEASLLKAINIYSRNRSAVDFYINEVDPYTGEPLLGKRAITNCLTVEHAYDTEKIFNEFITPSMIGGMTPCVTVHGDSEKYSMTLKRRREILRAHKYGEIAVVTNADLLGQGYDDPCIELCLNLAPSRSPVKVVQRVRNTRFDKSNPFKTAIVADFIDKVTLKNRRPLLYGTIVGEGHYVRPEVEEKFLSVDPESKRHTVHNARYFSADHEGMKSHKVIWNLKEVSAIIREDIRIQQKYYENNWKQKDDFSIRDAVNKYRLPLQKVRDVFYNLEPCEDDEDLWFDPDNEKDSEGNPITYHMGTKREGNHYYLCVKERDLEKLVSNYFPKLPKQTDEYSVPEMARLMNTTTKTIYPIVRRLVLLEKENSTDQENLYIDPVEEAKYPGREPITFKLNIRLSNAGEDTPCMKKEDFSKFSQIYFPTSWKKEDELSANVLAEEYESSSKLIRTIFKRMVPLNTSQKDGGEEIFYIDPVEEAKYPGREPVTFRIVERRSNGSDNTRYLKLADERKFKFTYFPYDSQREGELSLYDTAEKLETSPETIKEIYENFIPVPDEKDTFIYPTREKDKNGNSITFQMVMRRNGLCLKEGEFDKFCKICFPYVPKKPNELSVKDMTQRLGSFSSESTIRDTLNRFVLFKEQSTKDSAGIQKEDANEYDFGDMAEEALYIDPVEEAKYPGREPVTFRMAKRRIPPSIGFCMNEDDFTEKYEKIYRQNELKKSNELSAHDINKKLKISFVTASALLKRYRPYHGQDGMWFDPQTRRIDDKQALLPLVMRRGSQGDIICFDESYLDVFAKQHDLKYREPPIPKHLRKKPKKENEIPITNLATDLKAAKESIWQIFNRLERVEVPVDQNPENDDPDGNIAFIDPIEEAKYPDRKPNLYHLSYRQSGKSEVTPCLLEHDYYKFKMTYFPYSPKESCELLPAAINKRLIIEPYDAEEILNRLEPVEGLEDKWYDPTLPIGEQTLLGVVVRRVGIGKHARCLVDNYLDIFSKQYNRPYRRYKRPSKTLDL